MLDILGFLFLVFGALVVGRAIVKAWLFPRYVKMTARETETVQELVQEPVFETGTEELEPEDITPKMALSYSRHLSREDLIILLASQKDVQITSNAIYAVVKGNKSDVLELIREARGKREYVGDMRKRVLGNN